MTPNTVRMDRPLTKAMIETLMEAHERLLMNLPPLDVALAASCKGLIARGLMEIEPIIIESGKKVFSLFITSRGIDYLSRTKK